MPTADIASGTAVWYHAGLPALPIRMALILLALYSPAMRLVRGGSLPLWQAAWYRKPLPTFSDALAAVRRQWWRTIGLSTFSSEHDIIKVPRRVFQRLHEVACHAA